MTLLKDFQPALSVAITVLFKIKFPGTVTDGESLEKLLVLKHTTSLTPNFTDTAEY
jgi:hypothetical protein